MNTSDQQDRDLRNHEFVRLLAEHELRLAGYVHTLVPAWHDAEDILQNTKLRLWEQFDSFELGTDFPAWAFTVAGFLIREYRKRCQRQHVCFNDDLIEKLAQYLPVTAPPVDDRVSALAECAKALTAASRKLLRLSCLKHQTIKDIAHELGQTPAAAYQTLSRIRRKLFDCVEKRLNEEKSR